jgi:hypothetical protein
VDQNRDGLLANNKARHFSGMRRVFGVALKVIILITSVALQKFILGNRIFTQLFMQLGNGALFSTSFLCPTALLMFTKVG